MDIEGMYLNIRKAICDKSITNILITGEMLNAFLIR